MTISLQGQVVVVTGGAVRVGRAIALACAGAGADVAISYNRSEGEAREAIEELQSAGRDGARFACFQADVSRAEDVSRLTADVLQTFGRVTALVNNAAIFRRTPFDALTEADFDDHIAANLKGPYLLSKSFGDIFRERFAQQGAGAIVNIADIHGLRPLRNYIPYCVSKAGLVMLTEAMAKALAPHARVNCICPGAILLPSQTQGKDDGEFADDEAALTARVPLERLGTPEEIAQAVVFLLGGPGFISGAILPVDGAQRLR